jgi:Peptidase A4 family
MWLLSTARVMVVVAQCFLSPVNEGATGLMRKPHFPKLLTLPAMGALAAATVMAAGSVSVGAATAGQGFGPRISSPHIGAPHTNAGNWGGYAKAGSAGEFTSVSGTWNEPAATCKGSALAAPWIGIDGDGNNTVEQTGAAVSCSGSGATPQYQAWYEMYPRAPHYFSNPVSSGDAFKASVTYEGGTSYKLTISDTTKGWTHTVTQSLSAQNATAEAILEAPGGFPNFPNGVTFKTVTVNGKSFKSYSPSKLTATGGWTPGAMNANGGFTIKHT